MISYTSLLFYINAAVELSAILLLMMLLVSCIIRKAGNRTKRAFILLVIDLFILLLCNMTTWILGGMLVSMTYLPWLYILELVLSVSDFFFYCLASVIYLNYLFTLTGRPENRKTRRLVLYFLVAYCFVTTGFFASSLKTGWFFRFSEDRYIYYTPAYWILVALSIPAVYLSFVSILRNRKLLGKQIFLLLSYLVIPILLAITDQVFSLSISYVCMAFNALIIYVGVDVEQDRRLLAQEAEIIKHKAENIDMNVRLMVSQIQPHFLYNTLGTIYYLCGKDVSLAQKTIKSFTKYLRTNMENLEKNKLVSFEEELEHTKTYLSIELLRFSDILKVEYDISQTDFELPALSLQPLVENAVKYGIRSRENGGTVTISTKREGGKIYVSVHDNGMGYDTSNLPDDGRVHVGIANIRKRLAYMCSGRLQIDSEIGVGTTATIIMEDVKNESTAD